MGRRKIAMKPAAADAAIIIGAHIRAARTNKRWTAKHLGGVIGASESTVLAMEKGTPNTSLGVVLNALTALGLPLLGSDSHAELIRMRAGAQQMVGLLPARVTEVKQDSDDDF